MADNDEQLIHELALMYVSKTFNFKGNGPAEFASAYQGAYSEIRKALGEQGDPPDSSNFGVHTYD